MLNLTIKGEIIVDVMEKVELKKNNVEFVMPEDIVYISLALVGSIANPSIYLSTYSYPCGFSCIHYRSINFINVISIWNSYL